MSVIVTTVRQEITVSLGHSWRIGDSKILDILDVQGKTVATFRDWVGVGKPANEARQAEGIRALQKAAEILATP